MTTDKKLFRTSDTFTLRNCRVMVVEEPRVINDETTLCSIKLVSQPGDEKYIDMWVRVTGKNGLAEKMYNLKVGDYVNVSGKPYFQLYTKGDGTPGVSCDIRFPDFVDFLGNAGRTEKTDTEETEAAPVKTEEAPKRRGRPPGAKKTMPFDAE
jgi:hypothetical protein